MTSVPSIVPETGPVTRHDLERPIGDRDRAING